MDKYTGYIVDDESLARYTLKKKLTEFPEIEIIVESNNIQKAIREISEKEPEILFLDIQLNEGTGFDLLNDLTYTGRIIFITAFEEYAIRAFDINAIDYLLKPISNKRLKQAIERIMEPEIMIRGANSINLNYDDRFMVTSNSSINFIKISDIVFIKSSSDYTELRLCNGKSYLESRSMQHWEESLPKNHFCRISRFYIINFDYISRIEKSFSIPALLYIEGNSEPFKISKAFYQRIKLRYKY
jgi:two-component system LytT family response regulator